MAMIHHKQYNDIFGHGVIPLMARHGFIRSEGNLVEADDVAELVKNLEALKADKRSTLSPTELAAVLACPVDAVFSVFCRNERGLNKYGKQIDRYQAHDLLTKLLNQK